MKPLKKLQTILLSSLLLLPLSCSKPKSSTFYPSPNPRVTNELSSNTKVLSEDELEENLLEVRKNEIIFAKPVDFSLGDIIVGGISPNSPDGFLREILYIGRDEKTKNIAVSTQKTTLEKAIKTASIKAEISPPSGDCEFITPYKNIKWIHESHSLNIPEAIENMTLDLDGNPATKNDIIDLEWKFKIHSNNFINCEIRNNHIKEFSFTNKSSLEYLIKIGTSDFIKNINKDIEIAEYKFPSFTLGTIPGTPFPLIVKPKINLNLIINGKMPEISASVNQEISITSKIYYENGRWNKESKIKNSFNYNHSDILQKTNIEASLNPILSFLFYGVAGPYASIEGSLKAKADKSRWVFSGTLEGLLGVDATMIGKGLNYSKEIFNESKLFACGPFNKNIAKEKEPIKEEKLHEKIKPIKKFTALKLEDYFLKGKEMEGLMLAPDFDGLPNPYLPDNTNKLNIRDEIKNEIKNIGGTSYIILANKSPALEFKLFALQIKDQRKRLEIVKECSFGENHLIFSKENVVIAMERLEERSSLEQERILIKDLINYQKRIDWENISSEWINVLCEQYGKDFGNPNKFFSILENFQKEIQGMNYLELVKYLKKYSADIRKPTRKGIEIYINGYMSPKLYSAIDLFR